MAILVVAFLAYASQPGTPTTSSDTGGSSTTSTQFHSTSETSTTSFPSFTFTTSTATATTTTTSTSTATSLTSTGSTTTLQAATTYGTGASLSCFVDLQQNSSSQFLVDGMTAYRIDFVNPAGTAVIVYVFPELNASLAPGARAGYSLVLAGNSTFDGVYLYADLAANYTITGFAGIGGSSYYSTFPSGNSTSVGVRYLVPEGVSLPYVLGVTNSYSAAQTVSGSIMIMATCGDSWVSQASGI